MVYTDIRTCEIVIGCDICVYIYDTDMTWFDSPAPKANPRFLKDLEGQSTVLTCEKYIVLSEPNAALPVTMHLLKRVSAPFWRTSQLYHIIWRCHPTQTPATLLKKQWRLRKRSLLVVKSLETMTGLPWALNDLWHQNQGVRLSLAYIDSKNTWASSRILEKRSPTHPLRETSPAVGMSPGSRQDLWGVDPSAGCFVNDRGALP